MSWHGVIRQENAILLLKTEFEVEVKLILIIPPSLGLCSRNYIFF